MKKMISIGKAADLLGVAVSTLREWDHEGKLIPVKTFGKHRRYLTVDILRMQGTLAKEIEKTGISVITYARVSSSEQKQKGDLGRQHDRLQEYCAAKGYTVVNSYQEVGSGMSDTRPKLLQLFKMVQSGEIKKVIVEFKDRLARFNLGFLKAFFESHNVEIECIEEVIGKTFEAELVADMLSLISSFSSKIYGKRSAGRKRNKQDANTTRIQDGIKSEQPPDNTSSQKLWRESSCLQLGTGPEETCSPKQDQTAECNVPPSRVEPIEENGLDVGLPSKQVFVSGSLKESGPGIRQLLEKSQRTTKREKVPISEDEEQEEGTRLVSTNR